MALRSGSRKPSEHGARRSTWPSHQQPERSEPEGPDDQPMADPGSVARTICLSQLDRGPRTRSQLEQTLRKRLVPDEAATTVLDRLTEVGLIDDAAFAASWVHARRSGRGLSASAIARELRERGVDQELVAEAVAEVGPEDDEASARDLVSRRLRSMGGLPTQTQVRRLVGYLARKGYPAGLAYRVVKEALEVPDHAI